LRRRGLAVVVGDEERRMKCKENHKHKNFVENSRWGMLVDGEAMDRGSKSPCKVQYYYISACEAGRN